MVVLSNSHRVNGHLIRRVPNHRLVIGHLHRLDDRVLFDVCDLGQRTNVVDYILGELASVALEVLLELVDVADTSSVVCVGGVILSGLELLVHEVARSQGRDITVVNQLYAGLSLLQSRLSRNIEHHSTPLLRAEQREPSKVY